MESGRDVEGGGEWDEDFAGGRMDDEVVEGRGSNLEASGGAANIVDDNRDCSLYDGAALKPAERCRSMV